MNEIKLTKLEGFSIDIDSEQLKNGVFAWSGNYVLKLRVDGEKKKIYCTLYYANIDYRVTRAKKKKAAKDKESITVEETNLLLGK